MMHFTRNLLTRNVRYASSTHSLWRCPVAAMQKLQFSFSSSSTATQPKRNVSANYASHSARKQEQSTPQTPLESNVKEISVIMRLNQVSLEIQFENKDSRIFFIDDSFTFSSIREMIEFEYPSSSVDLDFTRIGSNLIDENSNLINFLSSSTAGELIVDIDSQQYVLRNGAWNPINSVFSSLQSANQAADGATGSNNSNVLQWYQECQKNGINPSHAGVVSYLISNFQHQVKQLKNAQSNKEIKLSETEIDNLFVKSFKSFSAPVTQQIEAIQHKINIVDQELEKLYKRRENMYNSATKSGYRYLKLILLVSVMHISAFYYMIFHVDWLGWDIIEPITYTVSQIAVVLGIRFFLKHRQVRSVESILEIFKERYLKKKGIKEIHANIMKEISQKESQKTLLQQRQKLLLNKKTYNTIQLQDI